MLSHRTHTPGAVCAGIVLAALLAAASPGPAQAELGNTGWFPNTALYQPYLADLRLSAESMIGVAFVPTVDIIDSGSPRYWVKLGGAYGIYRDKEARRPWQIDLEAAFASAQFDFDNGYEFVGWDGLVVIAGCLAIDEDTGVRLGYRHDSSHVGDELAERTGTIQTDYTREEAFAAFNRFAADHWRLYGEAGYGYRTVTEGQERWRFQGGAEFKGPKTVFSGLGGWYGAVNFASYQEKDYQLDWSLQGGIYLPSDGAQWRIALTLYKGTVPIGQFFEDDETYVILAAHLNP